MSVNGLRQWPLWVAPLVYSVLASAILAAILWGQYEQRVAALERAQQISWQFQKDVAARLADHDIKLAVIDQKLTTVVEQVTAANDKLDQAADERRKRSH